MQTHTSHALPHELPQRIRWTLQPWQRELILDVLSYMLTHEFSGRVDDLLAELLNYLPEIQFDPRPTITVIDDKAPWWPLTIQRKPPSRPVGDVFSDLKYYDVCDCGLFSLIHRAEQAAEDMQ